MLFRIREELAEHVHCAAVNGLEEDLPRLCVGRLGDQGIERVRRLEQLFIHQGLEFLQVVGETRQAFSSFRTVVLHQVFGHLNGIGIADEGGIIGGPENTV